VNPLEALHRLGLTESQKEKEKNEKKNFTTAIYTTNHAVMRTTTTLPFIHSNKQSNFLALIQARNHLPSIQANIHTDNFQPGMDPLSVRPSIIHPSHTQAHNHSFIQSSSQNGGIKVGY
jgi:hypothetical protein